MFKFKLTLFSLFAVLTMSVIGSAMASAAVQHTYVCEELTSSVSNGFENLSKCVKSEGASGGKWTKYKLAAGVSLKASSKGTSTFVLKSRALSLTVKIECTTEADKGAGENPTGGGAGKGADTIEFTGCTVPEPAGQNCTVKEPIISEANTELTEFSGKAAIEFKPKSTNFTEITFAGCSANEINKTYPIKGTDIGIAVNNTSEREFTVASSNLSFGGEPTTLKGKSQVLMEGSTAHLLILP